MIFHLIPCRLGGDCVDDLYRTGVCTRKDVEHDWVNGVGAQAMEDFQEAGDVREDKARDRRQRLFPPSSEGVGSVKIAVFRKIAI